MPEGHDLPALPARMVNEYVYCPRLFYLEWVQGEWAESPETVAGSREHRRVDREVGHLPSPTELAGAGFVACSVSLSAPREGLVARMDVLEGKDGVVVPIDYKHGSVPEEGIWDADRAQLATQALVLRENGYVCNEAIAYYVKSKRRVSLTIDDALVEETRDVARSARKVAQASIPPPPLEDSPKCPRCSLVGICLPDETHAVAATETDGGASTSAQSVRRLYPARDDALPLYVQAQGARVGKRGDELVITERDGNAHRVRMMDVSQVSLYGGVQITSGALSELLRRGTPTCHFSFGGWFQGITQGIASHNCEVRLDQYRVVCDPAMSLELARGFVERKIRNSRTLLRRNAEGNVDAVLAELDRSALHARRVTSQESLLGVEGMAARAYFGAFSMMLKGEAAHEFDFGARNRRPPKDPVNALLSLAYSILSKDWTIAALSVGLDPFLGVYHRHRFGRPALALDLMEEFRSIVADSVVLLILNNGEVRDTDFVRRGPAVALTTAGRKKFFVAYERRMSQLVTHPMFGYRVSYRRLLEVQARLFARHLSGELDGYHGFRTR